MNNSNDCSNEEKMLSLLTDLQAENERLRAQIQPIEPLIATIQQQERSLTELSAYNKSLTAENEKLLKLSEQERKLSEENRNLKQSVRELERSLKQKESEVRSLTEQARATADRFNILTKMLPSSEDIANFSKAVSGAGKAVEQTHILNYVNYAVVGVFALLVVFCGWQVYYARADVKNLTQSVQEVYNGIYNSEGWSVLEGTVMNEWVYSQKHPEAYQRYLQDKEKRQQQQ